MSSPPGRHQMALVDRGPDYNASSGQCFERLVNKKHNPNRTLESRRGRVAATTAARDLLFQRRPSSPHRSARAHRSSSCSVARCFQPPLTDRGSSTEHETGFLSKLPPDLRREKDRDRRRPTAADVARHAQPSRTTYLRSVQSGRQVFRVRGSLFFSEQSTRETIQNNKTKNTKLKQSEAFDAGPLARGDHITNKRIWSYRPKQPNKHTSY